MYPQCPLCSQSTQVYLFSRQESRVMRCANCGLVRREPAAGARSSADDTRAAAPVNGSARGLTRQLAALQRRAQKGSDLLLFGGNDHPFGQAVRTAGFRVTESDLGALEPSTATAPFTTVCVLFQLERTVDPVSTLQGIHGALKPGGVLLLVTPSLDSWQSRMLRSQWTKWGPDTHFYFDPQTIQSLLLRCGFEGVEVETDPRTSSMTVTATRGEIADRPVLSIVMPVYNERATVERTLEAVLAKDCAGVDKEIVIVESRSTDGTREVIQGYEGRPGVRVIYEERPRGKGAAVRTGLQHATGFVVLIQDADDEYDVNDYDALIEPIVAYRHAFVLGSRHTGSWKVRTFADQPALATILNFGHVLFRTALNVLYRQRLDDPFTMYKVFRRDCLHRLHFECNRFDFDFELVIKLIRKGYVPVEIPVNYRSRSFSEGKKVSAFRDPLTWIRALVKYRFAPIYANRTER